MNHQFLHLRISLSNSIEVWDITLPLIMKRNWISLQNMYFSFVEYLSPLVILNVQFSHIRLWGNFITSIVKIKWWKALKKCSWWNIHLHHFQMILPGYKYSQIYSTRVLFVFRQNPLFKLKNVVKCAMISSFSWISRNSLEKSIWVFFQINMNHKSNLM